MKITNLALFFIIIVCCFMVQSDVKADNLQAVTNKQILYKQGLDNAVDDAVMSLVEVDSSRQLVINKECCVNNFYQSLYSSFGIRTDKKLQEQLKAYIPVILIIDEDGYYIRYNDLNVVNGDKIVHQNWTEKRPYAYEDNDLIYSFTLSDYVKLYDKNTKELREGKYQDLAANYPEKDILVDPARFDEVRRNTIVNSIIDDMKYYINRYNRIAQHYGISYNFALPYIQQEDWYRTINDVGMMVIFQGYPYGGYTRDTFNQYSFAGARIRKTNCYYIAVGTHGKTYYHKDDCGLVTDMSFPYYSKKECALEGAWPCPECNP